MHTTRVPSGGGTTSSPRTAPSGGHASSRPAVEHGRLLRAIEIIRKAWIERLGARQFRVRGHEEPEYFVDLDGDPPCYCLDMQHSPGRVRQCKHMVAARLMNYDPAIFEHMVDVIMREEQRKKEVER